MHLFITHTYGQLGHINSGVETELTKPNKLKQAYVLAKQEIRYTEEDA